MFNNKIFFDFKEACSWKEFLLDILCTFLNGFTFVLYIAIAGVSLSVGIICGLVSALETTGILERLLGG